MFVRATRNGDYDMRRDEATDIDFAATVLVRGDQPTAADFVFSTPMLSIGADTIG